MQSHISITQTAPGQWKASTTAANAIVRAAYGCTQADALLRLVRYNAATMEHNPPIKPL